MTLSPPLQQLSTEEREDRAARARQLVNELNDLGVVAVAVTFVDNSGIARVKAVPLPRLPQLAAWGVGFSTAFDYFRFDDWVAGPDQGPDAGTAPVGDQRIIPDLGRLVPLAAQPGWAWAPGDRWTQDGSAHAHDSRLLLARVEAALAEQGLTVRTAYELEWVVSAPGSDAFAPPVGGAAYGMARLTEASAYSRDLLAALQAQGVVVEQYHPEYAAGQFELSVAPEAAVAAADTSVLVRSTIRAVGAAHGWRTSFSPKVDVSGVGNGGHTHLSLWREVDGEPVNLMAGGPGRHGLTTDGEGFAAGILDHLPALLALGAPGVASYLRLVPSHWAGVYAAWGLENRETALRMVTGSTGSHDWAANLEVKCFDLQANPYLLLAGLLACGAAGIESRAALPDPVEVDPASLDDAERADRGIERLPESLPAAVAAFGADEVLQAAFGAALVRSITAVRESEVEQLRESSPEAIADAVRWVH